MRGAQSELSQTPASTSAMLSTNAGTRVRQSRGSTTASRPRVCVSRTNAVVLLKVEEYHCPKTHATRHHEIVIHHMNATPHVRHGFTQGQNRLMPVCVGSYNWWEEGCGGGRRYWEAARIQHTRDTMARKWSGPQMSRAVSVRVRGVRVVASPRAAARRVVCVAAARLHKKVYEGGWRC